MECKKCNTVILGDGGYRTDLNDVTKICTSGTNVGGNLYESHKTFRVIECKLKSGLMPPNCDYKKVGQRDIMTKKITVACEKNHPVHLEC